MSLVRKSFTICNSKGLHARAATQFVKAASGFDSEITVYRDAAAANGKSVMSLLILAAPKGSVIEVEINGDDAEQAILELATLVNGGFGEIAGESD
ncbi:MAG TPA: HPr family phosphocarrier protein [Myxococcales bacterium]|nr:HPr family phosphocarrier protein [Myxococcales bacterium]HIN85579.1 HPr family phosphocarrier protein [Myxococcales bacterium]